VEQAPELPETTLLTAPATETVVEQPLLQTAAAVEEQPQQILPEQQESQAPERQAEAPVQQTAVAPTIQSQTSVQTETPEQQQDSQLPTQQGEEQDDQVTVTQVDAGGAQPVFQRVESNMIKVSEAAPARESEATQQTDDIQTQVADQLTDALSKGETKVELHLTPASLGDVTVEVTQQRDGSLQVLLTAENSHTRQLLSQHAEGLQSLLSGQEERTVQVEVSRQEETGRQDSSDLYDGQNGRGQEERQREQGRRQGQDNSQDFLQQLRLGLIPAQA
jgi:flagellar hook-length control protein FliK